MALTLMRLENGITEGVRGNWSGASSGILRATRVALACFFFSSAADESFHRRRTSDRVVFLFFLNGLSGFTVLPGFTGFSARSTRFTGFY